MEIRKAGSADSDQIFSLVQDLVTSFEPTRRAFAHAFRHLLVDDSALLLVAESKGDVVGYCLSFDHYAFYANGRVTWVEEILVREDHRDGGIGSQALKGPCDNS